VSYRLHRHCERSEAIQTASADMVLDCFVAALLAMTSSYRRTLKNSRSSVADVLSPSPE
jgi:hypothetical protein